MSETPSGIPILVSFGISRTFTSIYGLLYLAIGILIPTIPLFVTISTMGGEADLAQIPFFSNMLPVMIPLFSAIGSMGVTYLFSSDRSNGIYEYLIATRRIKVRDIFISYAVVDVIAVSIVLGATLAIMYGFMSFSAPSSLPGFFKLVGVFSVPVAYFSSLISALAMLTWSSLSKVYPGVNAPGGIGSIIGVIPPVIFLLIVARSGFQPENLFLMGELFSIVMMAIFIVFLFFVTRVMSNERMLA